MVIPTDDERIAVFDTGCDLSSGLILAYITICNLQLASHCFTNIVCKDKEFIGVVNQCLVDPNPHQIETLLQPQVLVDNIPPCHLPIDKKPGTLCLKAGETTVP